ncbi:hypothetical protein ILFOPFJJ_06314 [Ensifer psoraleae]|nr:hypothetical protein [Sinorhizobium psoraleae]
MATDATAPSGVAALNGLELRTRNYKIHQSQYLILRTKAASLAIQLIAYPRTAQYLSEGPAPALIRRK